MPGDSAFTPSELTRVTLLGNAIRFTLISAPPAQTRLRNDTGRGESAPAMSLSNGGPAAPYTLELMPSLARRSRYTAFDGMTDRLVD